MGNTQHLIVMHAAAAPCTAPTLAHAVSRGVDAKDWFLLLTLKVISQV